MDSIESLESRKLLSGDFNADGIEDLVVHDTQTGAARVHLLNNNRAVTSQVIVGTLGAQWQVAHIGSLDDDANDDAGILWHNPTASRLVAWQMNGTTVNGYRSYPYANANLWTFAAAGEHDDPGGPDDTDLLWQNKTTGALVLWEMNGRGIADTATVGVVPAGLKVVGMSEVRGDDPYDLELLVRNEASGANQIWRIDNNAITSKINLPSAGPAWRVAGYIDADDDNPGDVIWHNRSTGQLIEWELSDAYSVEDRNAFAVNLPNRSVSIGG